MLKMLIQDIAKSLRLKLSDIQEYTNPNPTTSRAKAYRSCFR